MPENKNRDPRGNHDEDSFVFALADIIANMHDWPTEDPKSEFTGIAARSFPLDRLAVALEVFDRFNGLTAELRFEPSFDHEAFVRDILRGCRI